ncbi:hypothetical protein SOPP22_12165 [Shewanella sp. OPT22]|nr:hypothetical protein SOPP22_12165 [Shewanella sp. OPT22]
MRALELIEKKYRDTSITHKKYIKRLNDYITTLLTNGRIIEAKYFFSELQTLSSEHKNTLLLGYKIAIKTFDSESILHYDKKLVDLDYNFEELVWIRLQYYYSVNNRDGIVNCAQHLLSKSTKLETDKLQFFTDIILNNHELEVFKAFNKYLYRVKLKVIPSFDAKVKFIAYQKLVDIVVRIKITK